jgi:hypothetical protein
VSSTAVTCQTAALPVATTYVKATYATTATGYAGNTSATAASITVTKATPIVTLAPSASSAVYGTPVTLTVGGLTPGAAGTVAFTYGSSSSSASSDTTAITCGNAGATTVAAGAASCTTSTPLPAGSDYVVATVTPTGGSADYSATTFADTPQLVTVTQATAAVSSVAASPTSAVYGASVTLTATVTPSGAAGTVVFYNGPPSPPISCQGQSVRAPAPRAISGV